MKHRHHDHHVVDIDRSEAARLLRAARAAREQHDGEEAIDWAFAALSDRRHARRLKVEALIRARNLEAADALIAQGLLLRPHDTGLVFLRARSLLLQQNPTAAEREIAIVLEHRPSHVSSLALAAEIARARHDYPCGIHRLETALALRPNHDGLRERLAALLLDADLVDRADTIIAEMATAPARLRARALRARRRQLDAVELLEDARATGDPDGMITSDLIDALEGLGAVDRLASLLETIDESAPATLVRAGSAWLGLGAWRTAIDRLAPLCARGPRQREALSVSVVAASMAGRIGEAERLLTRLQEMPEGADPSAMADLWRRALTAHVFLDQARTGRAQAVRGRGLIDPLLRAAIDVFDAEPASRTPGRRAEIQRHRALCLAALGRDREAAAALGESAADDDAIHPRHAEPLRVAA